jgi:hypothetical protein
MHEKEDETVRPEVVGGSMHEKEDETVRPEVAERR